MKPVIAIVGRPNVGKSTIFNSMIGRRQAIESRTSGTTRDRIYANLNILERDCILVDTGGLEFEELEDIEANIQVQSRLAIEGADVIMFVVDVKEELTSNDFEAAEMLRKSKLPIYLIANKCDNSKIEEKSYGLYELGFGEPILMSAIHRTGVDELLSKLHKEIEKIPKGVPEKPEEIDKDSIQLSFIGRPNVGKSSLMNAIIGENKVIVSNTPGTTRDSIYIPFEFNKEKFTIVDTAGIRRRGKVEVGLEKFSVLRALHAVEESDITVLVIDYSEGLTSQDMHVSAEAIEQAKGVIIAVNKIDLMKDREIEMNRFIRKLQNKLDYLSWAPVVFVSAVDQKNVQQILKTAIEIKQERQKEVEPEILNLWLQNTLRKHPYIRSRGSMAVEFNGVTQTRTEPPTFQFKMRNADKLHFSYRRYLENSLRKKFGFIGTAIKMKFT